jgi:hypothetical protein
VRYIVATFVTMAMLGVTTHIRAESPPTSLPPGMRLGPEAFITSVYQSAVSSKQCATAIPGRNIDLGTLHMYEEGGCNEQGGTADMHYTTITDRTPEAVCYTVSVRPASRVQRCSQKAILGYYLLP